MDPQAHLAQLVPLVLQAREVNQVPEENQVLLEPPDQEEPQAVLGNLGHQGHRDHKVRGERVDREENQDHKDSLGHLALEGRQVKEVRLGHPVRQAPQENLVGQGQQDPVGHQDSLDQQERGGNLEAEDNLERGEKMAGLGHQVCTRQSAEYISVCVI